MFKPINDRDRLAMDEAKIGKVSWSLKAATEEIISMDLPHGISWIKHPKRRLWKGHTDRT
jgi:hypothetical protein